MKHGQRFALWTLLWLIAAGWIGWLMTRPVPAAWLRTHARRLGFVRTYARIAEPLQRWQTNPFTASNAHSLVQAGGLHPAVFLADSAMPELRERYTPTAITRHVQRLKTLLLAPVSDAAKQRAVADPFRINELRNSLVSPALTSAAPAMYVFTFGARLDDAVHNAEAVYRLLDSMHAEGDAGACQGVCSFISSPAHQAERMRRFIQSLDAFECLATFEHALERDGVDRALLSPTINAMRTMRDEEPAPVSVATQAAQLQAAGLQPLLRYFLDHHPDGYVSTHRVLAGPDSCIDDTRARVQAMLDEHFIDGVAYTPTLFTARYRMLLRLMLLGVAALWALGIAVAILAAWLNRVLTRLVLREDPNTSISSFCLMPMYARYLRAHGLASFDDFLQYGSPVCARTGAQPVERRSIDGDPFRRDRIELPLDAQAPPQCRRDGRCTLHLVRGRGRAAATVAAHARAILKLRARGIPTLPLIACGDAEWHGHRHAFYVVLWRACWQPVAALQDARAGLEGWWSDIHPPALMEAYGDILCECRRQGLYGHEPTPALVVFERRSDGALRVRVAGLRPAACHGRVTRVLRRVVPWLAHARLLKSMTAVNRRLYPEYFSLRDRLRLYRRAIGRARLTLYDKRMIQLVMRRSLARGYTNYTFEWQGLCVNPSLQDMLMEMDVPNYAALLNAHGERTVTRKRGRTVVTLSACGTTVYLKRHTGVALITAVVRWLRHRRAVSEARLEWEAVMRLACCGIRTIPVVAMGERFRWGFWERDSLLLTAQLPGGTSLEDELNAAPALTSAMRQELAREIGRLARRLHMAELVHRDFYLGHIYVVGVLQGRHRLHLLDLQRVRPGARLYNRWALKDITGLHFSSIPVSIVHHSDRMRFLCAYLAIDTLDERARRFARRVVRKSRRVARHTEKLLARRRRRGELPACTSPPP